MKYNIFEDKELLLLRISGQTRKNEALLVRRDLFPYLQKKGMKVIIDLNELEQFEIVTLILVLNVIKKEVKFLKGEVKLCSLKPNILTYFKENHLDQIFEIHEDEERAKKSKWRKHDKR